MDGCGPVTGSAYYQNLCMRAVNQSVGRAIRHAQDYAAIVLLDRRYVSDARVQSSLPGWLRRSGGEPNRDVSFEQRMDELESFFKRKEK